MSVLPSKLHKRLFYRKISMFLSCGTEKLRSKTLISEIFGCNYKEKTNKISLKSRKTEISKEAHVFEYESVKILY